jgi:hypothetical protein
MIESNFNPSSLQVDFDKNITRLYESITSSDWDLAVAAAMQRPTEAMTWVVRHYEEDDKDGRNEVMWRFLPIHSACARQPPANVISALLKAYPDGAKCVDDQGMYPLHYACGNQASREVVRQLLMAFPQAAKMKDPRGMLPIHYLTCWGPSSISVVDMVLVANRDVAHVLDVDGNTPMKLAQEGEYPERGAVITALNRWLKDVSAEPNERTIQSLNKIPTNVGSLSEMHSPQSMQSMTDKDQDIMQLKRELNAANEERDGLRETLTQLADEHDKFKMKSVILGDRLGSLNASLYGMMEQQNIVIESLRSRESQYNADAAIRREKMRELLALYEDDMDEFDLKESLLKQAREMEAIQAVIAAVRAGN